MIPDEMEQFELELKALGRKLLNIGYKNQFLISNVGLPPNESFKMRDVTDGTSNTIIIGEQSGKVAGRDVRGTYYGGWGSVPYTRKVTDPDITTANWGTGATTTIRYEINPTSTASFKGQHYHMNTGLNSFHVGGVHVLLTFK